MFLTKSSIFSFLTLAMIPLATTRLLTSSSSYRPRQFGKVRGNSAASFFTSNSNRPFSFIDNQLISSKYLPPDLNYQYRGYDRSGFKSNSILRNSIIKKFHKSSYKNTYSSNRFGRPKLIKNKKNEDSHLLQPTRSSIVTLNDYHLQKQKEKQRAEKTNARRTTSRTTEATTTTKTTKIPYESLLGLNAQNMEFFQIKPSQLLEQSNKLISDMSATIFLERPGTCPLVDDTSCSIGLSLDVITCSNDQNCDNFQICCYNPCLTVNTCTRALTSR